jgi:periplasmic protein TonB
MMLRRRVDPRVTGTGLLMAALMLAACGSPPPAPPVIEPAPTPATPPVATEPVPTPPVAAAPPSRRYAARDPMLDQWKHAAAQRIHAANAARLFSGRPHHLLQAVIVVEVAVDSSGRVTRSKILRSPGIGALDKLALASLKAASPLPAPPSKLVSKGGLVFSETWLFDNDGRFQLRTLALPQE